jgi:signal transduction histidine kinase
MSGNADLRSVIDAVNNGLMSQFVEKPWIDGALKIVLRNRLEANRLAHKNAELLVAVQNQNALLAQESEKTLLEVRQKERLFATMSHEIRNPLHGIQGILEILSQDEDLKEETKNLLSTAITSSTFMRQILDDVLDYSKSEAGKVVLQEKAFSPVALVQDLAGLMRPLAQGKQLSLDVHFKPALEQQVFIGDDFRIRQILNNLVSNAIKYTEVGGVEITLKSEEALIIVVSDSGIGIPEEKKKGSVRRLYDGRG